MMIISVGTSRWNMKKMRTLFLDPGRIYAAGHFEPAPFAAPVAAASFAIPLAHAFPFFAIRDDRIAFIDKFLQCRRGNAVNDGNHLGGAALRTCAVFFAFGTFAAGLF
jgi:hypothetical protein